MANNVTLSSAVRSNLLSLQNTSDLVKRTQGRLSTGLKVAGPIDDPVAYFQSKALSDRADDFRGKKENIDQGISTVTSGLNAVDGIEALVKQLKGLALSAKSATTLSEVSNTVAQFNELKTQINNLAADATYQGLNLVNGTGQTLSVSFSNDTASTLLVTSKDITTGNKGLAINDLVALGPSNTTPAFNYSGVDIGGRTFSAGGTVTVTLANSAGVTLSSGTHTFSYGTYVVSFTVGTAQSAATYSVSGTSDTNVAGTGGSIVLSAGRTITFSISTAVGAISAGMATVDVVASSTTNYTLSQNITGKTNIGVNFSDQLSSLITDLEADLNTIRSVAQQLGSNVALLQTRIDFTNNYVNTLTAGAGKLNLADLNEEGANLLALQTRQQLGIQALSFAGQTEQGILGLFR